MSTVKTTTPTNGATNGKPKVETNVSVLNTKPNNEGKPETKILSLPPSTTKQEEVNELPPLEDRFYKLDELFSLRDRHEKLKDSFDKLNKFKLSAEGRSDSITLKDDKGNLFTTHNLDVVKKMVDMLKEDLTTKIKEVDSQIRF